MRIKGFIGAAYTLRSVNIECQRCVNLYPEIDESQGAADGEVGALVSTPGLRVLGTCGTGPIRATYVNSTGAMAIVSGSEVYRVGLNWTFTKAGDLLTSSGPVSCADNGTQMMIVDGTAGYIVSLVTGTLTQITSAAFPGADTVTFQDGYFICNNPGTGQFFISGLYDGFTWDALDFATAEGSPDATLAVLSNQRQLWIFGAKTIEVWWNSGATDFPFSRIDGAFIEYGCIAAFSVAKLANTVIWLGAGHNGHGVVWMADGYHAKRVSNHGVELALQGYGDLSGATSWTYQQNGHDFYVLNIPTADASWVFDVSTEQWHERCSITALGTLSRSRPETYTYAFDDHVVGDYANGDIYALDESIYTEDGNPLVRMRRSPHLSANMKRLFFSKFELAARVGVGLSGSPVIGIDPQVELRYSDDFGHTWSPAQSRSLGLVGEYAKRVIWRRLGQSRTRVFEVRVSDPVEVAFLGAEVDAVPGAN